MVDDYYEKMVQLMMTGKIPEGLTTNQKKKLVVQAIDFQLIAREIYTLGPCDILWRCVLPHQEGNVLVEACARILGRHYRGRTTIRKVLHIGIWWPTLNDDATEFA